MSTSSLSSPDPAMLSLRQPPSTLSRIPAFNLYDFEQLVSDAFDSPPTPTLALTPASPTPSASASSPSEQTPVKSYFEDHDDDDFRLREPRSSRASRRPRSQSFSASTVQRILPSSSASTYGEPASRPGVARRVLQSLRSRASALVLRTSQTPNGTVTGRDTPASFITLSSRTSTSTVTPRPATFSQLSQHASTSRLDDEPLPGARSAPLEFLKTSVQPTYDGPRSAPAPSHIDPRSTSPAPTFLGDLVSANRSNSFAFSTLTRAPSLPSPALPPPPRVHTRLPPLKTSRSFFSKHEKKHLQNGPLLDPVSPTPSSSMSIEFAQGELPSRCSSPYTNPRPPPPVPPKPSAQDLWREEDLEQELEVPSYVFERRGSAGSGSSAASTRSTQTLAERISKAIPRSLRMAKGRTRSKLNLSVITSSSSESTPNSFDTSMTFSSSGYSASMPPTPQHSSFYSALASSRRTSAESEAMAVGRVLTPEDDPFKKDDITVPVELERTRTPTPFDEPPAPTIPRDAWMQRRPAHRVLRKASTCSGHAHTGSGDTITALTRDADERAPSPMVDHNGLFVFPNPQDATLPSSRFSQSPTHTPYHDWSPVSLRSNVPLPAATEFAAHVDSSSSGSTPSRTSLVPPSPGPPPTIPLPPSPSGSTSPILKRTKTQPSLRIAALVLDKDTKKRLGAERPPSPFPLTTSAFGSNGIPKGPRFEHRELPSSHGEQLFTPIPPLTRSASVPTSRPDPDMRTRAHIRATSEQGRPRLDSTARLSELEERWEGDTTRSTAFYSARSSMLSSVSTVFGESP